ncbi:unnamed protein product [Closterium sp. NIES-53]
MRGCTSSSAVGDEGRLGASPAAPTGCITGGQRDAKKVSDGKRQTIGESSKSKKTAEKPSAHAVTAEKPSAEASTAEKPLAEASTSREPSVEQLPTGEQFDDDSSSDIVEVVGAAGGGEGELASGEQYDDSDMVEVPIKEVKQRHSTRSNFGKPSEKLSYHACLPPTAYTSLLIDAEDDIDLPELDPDMHVDPEHHWDIANMTVKEALVSWKGKAVKAAMDESHL